MSGSEWRKGSGEEWRCRQLHYLLTIGIIHIHPPVASPDQGEDYSEGLGRWMCWEEMKNGEMKNGETKEATENSQKVLLSKDGTFSAVFCRFPKGVLT
ncbi:hypothetical protein KUCAC02_003037 [Chaenocephalus aceratus]|uniref:Uncharacterized protein n=1 Tax=Chaenocephalus aceratus TaxID=36190 RepID=A0ACB9WL64_CHAAC|nr:hypothetical protein KUCAC02_003037 [Chaenocephalus aceratus]